MQMSLLRKAYEMPDPASLEQVVSDTRTGTIPGTFDNSIGVLRGRYGEAAPHFQTDALNREVVFVPDSPDMRLFVYHLTEADFARGAVTVLSRRDLGETSFINK